MTAFTFEVRAKRPPEVEAEENAWLVYCRRCGWHCEIERGRCWKGCPECNDPLWLTLPAGHTFRLPTGPATRLQADIYDRFFTPKRRKNAWRTAPPAPKEATAWTPG